MTYISEILADPIDAGLRTAAPSLGRQSNEWNLDALATRLAGAISDLDPALGLLIAQRVITYTRDLLVRPVSPIGAHLLDDAANKLRWLTPAVRTAPAND